MNAVATGREIVETVREKNVPLKGASIAYYAISSLIPLLVVSLAALPALGATAALVSALQSALSDSVQAVLELEKAAASTRRGLTATSLAGRCRCTGPGRHAGRW